MSASNSKMPKPRTAMERAVILGFGRALEVSDELREAIRQNVQKPRPLVNCTDAKLSFKTAQKLKRGGVLP